MQWCRIIITTRADCHHQGFRLGAWCSDDSLLYRRASATMATSRSYRLARLCVLRIKHILLYLCPTRHRCSQDQHLLCSCPIYWGFHLNPPAWRAHNMAFHCGYTCDGAWLLVSGKIAKWSGYVVLTCPLHFPKRLLIIIFS